MRLTRKVYDSLISCPPVPPEVGGILGAEDKGVISHIYIDRGRPCERGGMYIPRTDILNRILEEWNERGIEFMGMFHTHAPMWNNLSKGDKEYIRDILEAMSVDNEDTSAVCSLYFPLVFPQSHILACMVELKEGSLSIGCEDVTII